MTGLHSHVKCPKCQYGLAVMDGDRVVCPKCGTFVLVHLDEYGKLLVAKKRWDTFILCFQKIFKTSPKVTLPEAADYTEEKEE